MANSNIKTILLFMPQVLPVPAVGGGAIETLVTGLLNENERDKAARLIVLSKYDEKAAQIRYDCSKVYYFENGMLVNDKINALNFKFFLLRISTKLKRIARKLGVIIKSWNDDIVYLDFFHFQCYQIAKKEKVDAVVHEGGGNIDEFKIFYKLVGKENTYHHLHCETPENLHIRKIIPNSIAISDFVKNAWVKDKTIVGDNITLYNGIDLDRFSETITDDKKNELRNSLGLAADDFVVLFCGRIIPEKGAMQLLDAMSLIRDKHIKLLLIGSVAFSNSVQTDYSQDVIKKANELENVSYLGYIKNEYMPQYYGMSNLMVVPSICQEGAGLVTIEAMTAGVPLLITESGGMVEYVGDCAVKVAINDELPNNLAKNIDEISKNEKLRKELIKKGKERAKLFSNQAFYRNFINIFDKDKV